MKILPANCLTKRMTCSFALLAALQLFFLLKVSAQGNLTLMPKRIVFEGSKKYEEINLANTGKDTARYVISLMHVRMKEDGGFEEITEPGAGENFADKYIRFFSHSVVLGQEESQVVKIQLNRTNELVPGEYRSHIYSGQYPIRLLWVKYKPQKILAFQLDLLRYLGYPFPLLYEWERLIRK